MSDRRLTSGEIIRESHFTSERPDDLSLAIHPQMAEGLRNLEERGVVVVYERGCQKLGTNLEMVRRVDGATQYYAANPERIKDELFGREGHPVCAAWNVLSRRCDPLSLLIFSIPEPVKSLGCGLDVGLFDRPFFDGKSAREVMTAEKGERGTALAKKTIERYRDYMGMPFDSPSDRPDTQGLWSKDYLNQGVIDSLAVYSRAKVVRRVIRDYATAADGGLRDVVSFGCGVADSTIRIAQALRGEGLMSGKIALVDKNICSLAVAGAIAEQRGVSPEEVCFKRQDLFLDSPDSYFDVGNCYQNVAEATGLLEYFPNEEDLRGDSKFNSLRPAENLIIDMANVAGPGGLVIFGNMAKDRPQQAFFDKVWPHLVQRTPEQALRMIERAGFERSSVSVHVSEDGVYPVYVIKMPADPRQIPKPQSNEERRRDGALVAEAFLYERSR